LVLFIGDLDNVITKQVVVKKLSERDVIEAACCEEVPVVRVEGEFEDLRPAGNAERNHLLGPPVRHLKAGL